MGDGEKGKNFQVSDRRFWVVDEEAEQKAERPVARYPTFVEELKARTEAAEQKLRERLNDLEKENAAFRSRLDRRVSQQVDRAKMDFLRDFLEILDNFERALEVAGSNTNTEALQEGVRLNLDLFLRKMASWGVEPIEPWEEPFDPNLAEAISVVAVETPDLDNKVIEVAQKGYSMGQEILRPAKVTVGRYGKSS